MFSLLSVFLITGGSPCDHYSQCIGPHCKAPPTCPGHQTWDPLPEPRQHLPPPPPCQCQTWTYPLSPTSPLLGTSGGHNWRPVQFFSLEPPPPPPVLTSDGWSTCGCQAGSTHTTGMIYCFQNKFTCCWNCNYITCRLGLATIEINVRCVPWKREG